MLAQSRQATPAGHPLRLRLVKVKIGKTRMWMLTSVLEPWKLTKTQIVRLYSMRWGIEVEFRGLKQTLDRAKLRCRNDRRLLAELNWSLMAMAVAELFALKQQLKPARTKVRPGRRSEETKPRQHHARTAVLSLRSAGRSRSRPRSSYAASPRRHRQLCSQLIEARSLPSAKSRQETLQRSQHPQAHPRRKSKPSMHSRSNRRLKSFTALPERGRRPGAVL